MLKQFQTFKRLSVVPVGLSLILLSCTNNNASTKNEESPVKGDSAAHYSALQAETKYTTSDGGVIAYRVIGSGKPIILCNRFRGTLDDWDPLFLDQLAKSNQVITFDYRGIGLSTLPNGRDSLMEIQDISDLAKHLGIQQFSLVGWSHGGKVAQVFAARNKDLVDNLVLLGTGPVGIAKFSPEKIFFDYALKPVNNFEDEIVLFFEPKYEESRRAAKLSHDRIAARTADTSKYVTPEKFQKYFESVTKYNADVSAMQTLVQGSMPILAISGEHDIVFPIEDWYAQTKKNPNLQIMMLPKAGHGPQSQYPAQTAGYITSFIIGDE